MATTPARILALLPPTGGLPIDVLTLRLDLGWDEIYPALVRLLHAGTVRAVEERLGYGRTVTVYRKEGA